MGGPSVNADFTLNVSDVANPKGFNASVLNTKVTANYKYNDYKITSVIKADSRSDDALNVTGSTLAVSTDTLIGDSTKLTYDFQAESLKAECTYAMDVDSNKVNTKATALYGAKSGSTSFNFEAAVSPSFGGKLTADYGVNSNTLTMKYNYTMEDLCTIEPKVVYGVSDNSSAASVKIMRDINDNTHATVNYNVSNGKGDLDIKHTLNSDAALHLCLPFSKDNPVPSKANAKVKFNRAFDL